MKNTSGNQLDNERLETCFHVSTSHILVCPDINIFVAKKQRQFSHGHYPVNEVGDVSCKNVYSSLCD
jgi:hypothetical protein